MSDTSNNLSLNAVAPEEDRLYTVKEMAAFLNVKVGSLKDWTKLKENPCPCLRYKARVLRFEKDEVLKWFKEQTKTWRTPTKE